MVEVSCAEDEVGREGEIIHPVCVGGEGVSEAAGAGVPDLDRLVVRGCVDVAGAAPADAGYAAFVPTQDDVDAFGDHVPDSDGAILG